MRRIVVLLLAWATVVAIALALSGCAQDRPIEEPIIEPDIIDETTALTGDDLPLTDQPDDAIYVEPVSTVFDDIHFEFDRYNILPQDESVLGRIARWLDDNERVDVLIEGHCDERGTNEYNMALGEQRALAARRYLVGLGISAERLGTISYGEERPLDPRSTEDAWGKNRRAHFVVSE
jgi:peptidoglycan-associated lipoprotein